MEIITKKSVLLFLVLLSSSVFSYAADYACVGSHLYGPNGNKSYVGEEACQKAKIGGNYACVNGNLYKPNGEVNSIGTRNCNFSDNSSESNAVQNNYPLPCTSRHMRVISTNCPEGKYMYSGGIFLWSFDANSNPRETKIMDVETGCRDSAEDIKKKLQDALSEAQERGLCV